MNSKNNISCLIVDDEIIAQEVLKIHLSKIDNINILACCSNAIEAFNYLRNHEVDLIFLDINMPEISGISFAKSINKDIKVIFTTAYREYAIEGFELQAVDYLLKPIAYERLLKAVNTYFNVYSKSIQNPPSTAYESSFIFVRSNRKMIKIDFNQILYIESYSDYIKIQLNNKTVVTRETISNIEVKLPQKQFLRVHRSYIVCFNKVDSFTNEQVTILNKTIPISRSYKKRVLKLLKST